MDRNLLIRTLSGAIMLVVVLGAMLASPYSGAILLIMISAGVMFEFYKIARLTGADPLRTYSIAIGVLSVATAFVVADGLIPATVLLFLLPLVCGLFVIELYRKSTMPLTNVAWAVAGIVYVAVPFALLAALLGGNIPCGGSVYRPLIVLSVIFIVWANDVGAYLVGRTFGRHKLFERISPNKSWEGFWGGVVSAVVVGVLVGWLQCVSLLLWAGAGVVIAVSGVYGDLVESMLKRSVNLKDSGQVIPGHGGVLDRFDALLMAVPFVFVYLFIFT